jgi:ATP-dependent RNA helicase DDX52/ROK1
MDAFRLLTRSTNLKSISGGKTSTRLPSAGKAENPQLFRSSSSEERETKKRKRGDDGDDDDGEAADADLNFFASTAKGLSANKVAATSKHAKKRRNSKDGPAAGQEVSESEEEEQNSMDESQRRSILKTHKIKIADMRDLGERQSVNLPNADDSKKKTKKKKKKEEKTAPVLSKKQQKEARRLYPEPLVSFQQLRKKYRISSRLAENIAEQGFSVPTEVQMGSLPLLLGGHSPSDSSADNKTQLEKKTSEPDLVVVAPTGSGKTLAFMIPLITKIVCHHHENPGQRGIFAVIVAPTKELMWQIVNEGRKLAIGTGVKITGMKKGMRVLEQTDDELREQEEEEEDGNEASSESDSNDRDSDDEANGATRAEKKQRRQNKSPVTKSDILVTTPMLLVHALSANETTSIAPMPSVRNLVLDEADVLLDPLFREQTSGVWSACTNPELRVSLWSATMGSNIEELTKSIIKERRASLDLADNTPLIRVVIGLKDSAVPNITHKLIYAATEQGKLLGLRQLIHPTATIASTETRLRPPFLIFTQTITRAVALHSEIMYDIPAEAGGSSRIAVLHSDLSETRRSEIMKGFRKGEIWVIVTTDLLSRGVDFRGINGVVNYDIPTSSAAYVHRVGRTGRAGRQGGIAVTFYTKEDIPYVKSIANLIDTSERLQGKEPGAKSVQKWLLDALPDLSKNDKKELKRHGVQARAASAKLRLDGKEVKARTRISTKSGFDRKMEHKRKGAIEGSRKKKQTLGGTSKGDDDDDDGWDGFEE